MLNPEQIVSAEVLLRSHTGALIDGNTIITSKNIAKYRPEAESVQIISQFFKNNGFQVGPLSGISVTVSGTANLFSCFFHTSLTNNERGGIQAILSSKMTSEALPIEILPKSVANLIITITFIPPPDLMPSLLC